MSSESAECSGSTGTFDCITPEDRRIVWKAHPVTGGESRWVKASYDTCAGVTIGWNCPDAGRPDGWDPVDTETVTWMEDPDPREKPSRRKVWILVTKGGRVIAIAVPT